VFRTIFSFEWGCWLKRLPFYGYAAVFFLIPFASMAVAAGALGQEAGEAEGLANSPMSLYQFGNFIYKFLLLSLPIFVGSTLYKDFANQAHSLLYSFPFSKVSYLLAKFSSGLGVAFLVALFALVGLFCGTLLPSIPPENLAATNAKPYLVIFFVFWLPGLFSVGALLFSLVLLTRNQYIGFILVLLLGILREAAMRSFGGTTLGLLLDPLGDAPVQSLIRFWTAGERDVRAIPLSVNLLANRLIWLGVGSLALVAAGRSFSFSQQGGKWSPFWRKAAVPPLPKRLPQQGLARVRFSPVEYSFSWLSRVRLIFRLAWVDGVHIATSGAFVSIVLAGMLFLGVLLFQINPQTDTKVLPTTWFILGFPVFFYLLFLQVLTYLYAGVLVRRAEAAQMQDLIAVTPVGNGVLWASRFVSLAGLQALLLAGLMGAGLVVQVWMGYRDINLSYYLFSLFIFHWPVLWVWALLALFVHVVLRSLYPGLFLLLLFALGLSELPSIGIKAFALRFNSAPFSDSFLYASDFDLFGPGLPGYFLFRAYWLLAGVLLVFLSLLFWTREHSHGIRERWGLVRLRFRGMLAWGTMLVAAAVVAFGLRVLWLEQSEPAPVPSGSRPLAAFYQRFRAAAAVPQPHVTALHLALDFYPESRSFQAKGYLVLRNNTAFSMDSLLVRTGFDERTELWFDVPVAVLTQDSVFQVALYQLVHPLAAGDSMLLHFRIRNHPNTLFTQNSNVLPNGTFLKSDILPSIGMVEEGDPPFPPEADLGVHYQRRDENGIRWEVVLSTSKDQMALTAGTLQDSWTQSNRNYFHYRMEQPVKFVLGFHSGEFDVRREQYRGVELALFHHPAHTACLTSIFSGLKASLDFHLDHFGTYPYRQLSVVEFARSEGSYATTSGNVISMSEWRFVHRTDTGLLDLPFYVAAHELGHQWWGNQLIPAHALGATVLTESICEYTSIKVYERAFGKGNALQFLKHQRHRYRQGRAGTDGESVDVPLFLASAEQDHLTYGKGALAFYTLDQVWGEAELLAALSSFLEKYRGGPPYPTSQDLLSHLKDAAPATMHDLIGDLFERAESERTLAPVATWLGE